MPAPCSLLSEPSYYPFLTHFKLKRDKGEKETRKERGREKTNKFIRFILSPAGATFRVPGEMAGKGRNGTRSAFNLLLRADLLLFHTRSSFEWPLWMITSYEQISPPVRMLLKRGTGE